MQYMIEFYQNIPFYINPIAFEIGFFQIGWYALSYITGFLVVYLLLIFRMKRDTESAQISNFQFPISNKKSNDKFQNSKQILTTFFLYAIAGILVGGRLGYVLFYNLPYYLAHPIEIISPYRFETQTWTGIYGMSYHGGLLAIILIAIWLCRKNRVNFWDFSDFVVPAIPAGYFFGRIGNFLNGELYGRATSSSWGMYFPSAGDGLLHYPSQIIEALLEGLAIFLILWFLKDKSYIKGRILFLYIFLYGLARFLAEFFRQPDEQVGFIWGFLTLGQVLSLIMLFAGFLLIFSKRWYNRI